MLDRLVARWARREAAVPGADAASVSDAAQAAAGGIGAVVAAVAALGLVDDARFAGRRASLDRRRGRSARGSRAALEAKGVPAAMAEDATRRDADEELAAAVSLLRRRRLGAFAVGGAMPGDRGGTDDDAPRRRALGILARAGFGGAAARAALALDREDAEALLAACPDD